MSPSSDDTDVPRSFDDRAADALLSGRALDDEPALSAFVSQVRALADEPGPAPSAALAALFEAGIPAEDLLHTPLPRQRRAVSWRSGGWALPLQLALAAAGCFALVLGAAAADSLPAPAQTAVADAVEAVTPLHLPRPHPADAEQPVPAVSPTATPAVTVTPTPERRTPSPAATSVREPADQGEHSDRRPEVRSGDDQGSDERQPATPRPTATPHADGQDGSHDGGDESSGDGDGEHPQGLHRPSSGLQER